MERFGSVVLNRLCPAVEGTRRAQAGFWNEIDAVFIAEGSDRGEQRGRWKTVLSEPPESWTISWDALTFELKLTPFGHVGLFPEQVANWQRIGRWLAHRPGARVLNLFAHTGGSTLAAAAAGAEVTHIDAARNSVDWARRNAALSGLAEAPIRWIAEDARKFVARELRRGCRYDAVILDPPSYGHGTRGESWRFSKQLPALLRDCFALMDKNPLFLLLTSHTPGYDAPRLATMLRAACMSHQGARHEPEGRIRGFRMALTASSGKRLASGAGALFLDQEVAGKMREH